MPAERKVTQELKAIMLAQYIAGRSYREIAQNHNLSPSTVEKLGAAELWTRTKENALAERDKEMRERMAEMALPGTDKFLDRMGRVFEMMVARYAAMIRPDGSEVNFNDVFKGYTIMEREMSKLMGVKNREAAMELSPEEMDEQIAEVIAIYAESKQARANEALQADNGDSEETRRE